MQGTYTHIPETNYVPREHGVAAILLFLFVVLVSLLAVLNLLYLYISRPDAERDGTRAETRIGLSAKRTSPFTSAGGSVQSTAGSRGVRISGSNGSNAGYTVF